MKRYAIVFLLLCQTMMAEIREVTPLEDFSQSLLGQEKSLELSLPLVEAEEVEPTSKKERPNSQDYVDVSEREERNGLSYRRGEEEPFSGTFALFMGEWIQYTEDYKNGLLEGESSWYDQKGTRILYEQYHKGKLNGKQISYYENGSPKAEIYYDMGRLTGVVCFDAKGKSIHKSLFDNGTGLWKMYWENGKLMESGQYKQYRKDGIWKKYHEDGSLESILEYERGRLLRESWN